MPSTDETRSTVNRPSVSSMARLVLVVLGIWLLLGIFMGMQLFLNGAPGGNQVGLAPSIGVSLQRYSIYAVLTFPVLWLCLRFPLASKRWIVPLFAHVAGLVVFMALYASIRTLSGTALDRATLQRLPRSLETATALVRSGFFEQIWMYAGIVTAALALRYYRQYRSRELREAELRRQMAEYELQVLKLQLHPHFLFNAMNGISTLMARDVKTAREMLVRLSELLRSVLSHSADNEVSLRDEVEFVKAYLELEGMRFGTRLRVQLDIDRASLEARVPNMIIQPLVENAIQYGIARIRSGGTLGLRTERDDGRLKIIIVNDGPRTAALHLVEGSGIGLANTRSRLRQLYGGDYQLRLMERPQGGAELHLEIPFRGEERSRQALA